MPDLTLEVTCPYCGTAFCTSEPPAAGRPVEPPECMPYTRDVGRFDPPSEAAWFDPAGWSRIGKDFLPALSWERIGILRLEHAGTDVRYRVQGCPACRALFDVYANYTEGRPLRDLWPHLFGAEPQRPGEIRPYHGQSWLVWVVRAISDGLKLPAGYGGALGVGVLLFAVGFLPALLAPRLGLAAFDQLSLIAEGLTYGLAALGTAIILLLAERYVCFLETTGEFADLLQVRLRRGLTHWRNFVLCRFVGVQTPGKLPQLTQVDIVAGGLSILALMSTWLRANWGRAADGSLFTALFTVGLLAVAAAALVRQARRTGRMLAPPGVVVAALCLLACGWLWWAMLPAARPGALVLTTRLAFWLAIAFVLGSAAWLALNSAVYVLRGLTYLPMNLTAYNGFAQARPLHRLRSFATRTMLTLYLTVITLVSIQAAFPTSDQWLTPWLRWDVAVLFAAMGLIASRGFLVLAILYVGIVSFTSGATSTVAVPFTRLTLTYNGAVLALGVFFTSLMVYYVLLTDRYVTDLLEAAKRRALAELDRRIDRLRLEVLQAETPPPGVVQNLESLLNIRSHVGNTYVRDAPPELLVKFASPVLWSLILPILWERMINSILPP